ncbi:EF-hand domain-containing protein [Nonomuraea phyllanthi]|uniref:EF-hand domain-containing protein n=1 Tax=Nonomuraea phyllanthi TaxID=2219224 RepID=A0A5C4WA61_9ACTN|nr:EF-hand domain-containing protein [Nonomuraea phyllanthi]KAB8192820.1 EF-hand domain-containing protein [Nonomuraea phyllanthi]QFY08298.1 EF-hand domain-containing protein [Nonomuraea phyllanthi]
MSEELPDERLARLKSTFASIDTDGDGYISEAELRRHFPDLPAEALGAMSQAADSDQDGRYSLEEFIRAVP